MLLYTWNLYLFLIRCFLWERYVAWTLFVQNLGGGQAFVFSFGHSFTRKSYVYSLVECLLNLLYKEVVNLKSHYETVTAASEFNVLIVVFSYIVLFFNSYRFPENFMCFNTSLESYERTDLSLNSI